MKLLFAKHFAIILLLSCFATRMEGYDQMYRDCPEKNCYECACNPLYCGAHDIQIHAGVMPIVWHQRGDIFLVNCLDSAPLSAAAEIPRFKDLFRTPWTVGAQVGHALSDNTRIYVEFNYARARLKRDRSIALTGITPAVNLNLELGRYRLYNFYVGLRYYTDRWCDRVSFFLGGKLGAVWHKRSDLHGGLTLCNGVAACPPGELVCFERQGLLCRSTVFSAGGHVGLDICFCGNWSFVITGEVVGNCGPCINRNVALNPIDSFALNFASNALFGDIGSELLFPITFGIRYTF